MKSLWHRHESKTVASGRGSGLGYGDLVGGISRLLSAARRTTARAANAVMTATYWDIGRRIVEFEQGGKARAEYGTGLLERLSTDLTAKHGRGFSVDNLERFRLLYLSVPASEISATALRKSVSGPVHALAPYMPWKGCPTKSWPPNIGPPCPPRNNLPPNSTKPAGHWRSGKDEREWQERGGRPCRRSGEARDREGEKVERGGWKVKTRSA